MTSRRKGVTLNTSTSENSRKNTHPIARLMRTPKSSATAAIALTLALASTALAATIIASSSSGVTNMWNLVDASITTYAQAHDAETQCPNNNVGFVRLNAGHCMQTGTGILFHGWEMITYRTSTLMNACRWTFQLTHDKSANVGPPVSTHVFWSVNGTTWHYDRTITAETSVQSTQWIINSLPPSNQIKILLAKSYGSIAPPTGPYLRWYELLAEENIHPSFCQPIGG